MCLSGSLCRQKALAVANAVHLVEMSAYCDGSDEQNKQCEDHHVHTDKQLIAHDPDFLKNECLLFYYNILMHICLYISALN